MNRHHPYKWVSFRSAATRDLEQFTVIQMNIGREISRRLRLADYRIFQTEMVTSAPNREYIFRSF